MKKLEALFCTIYQQWLMSSRNKLPSHLWEAKHDLGKGRIAHADVPEHQRNALLASSTPRGLCHKMSDMAAGPVDGFYYRNAPAYLIFAYSSMNFYIISIHNFLHEVKTSKTKSITEARAKEISIINDTYKWK